MESYNPDKSDVLPRLLSVCSEGAPERAIRFQTLQNGIEIHRVDVL